VGNLAVRTKSQTDLAGNEDIYFYTSRSLPHWIGQREGLARSQCGERSKLPRGVYYLSEGSWSTKGDPGA